MNNNIQATNQWNDIPMNIQAVWIFRLLGTWCGSVAYVKLTGRSFIGHFLFHCGSCFPLRVFASMMIEQNHPDHCRKRSSSLRPARVRKGRGSHRVKGCMLKTRSFQHVPCAGQPCHAGHCYATRCVKGTSLDVVEILPSLDAWTNT